MIRVEGVGELRSAFKRVGREVRRATAREVRRSAINVRNAARARVRVKSGGTRDSIQIDVRGTRGGVKATSYNAHWLELGTEHAPAYPYLFPSWEEERPQFEQRTRSATGEAVLRGLRG